VIRGIASVIRLRPDGLAIRRLRRGRAFLRWEELRAIHREAGDLVERLVLVTDHGRLALSVGFSSKRIAKLQARILDYHERILRARRRADLGVDELRRERLDRPVRIAKPMRAPSVFLGCLGVAMLALAVYATVPAVALGLVLLYGFAVARNDDWRVLELSREGIFHGPSDADLRLLHWDELVGAHRVYTVHETTRAVRLLLGDGRYVDLTGEYDRPLDDICELVDPPLEKVANARDEMLGGASLRDAAENVGLPKV
jgi:hypothetical protein